MHATGSDDPNWNRELLRIDRERSPQHLLPHDLGDHFRIGFALAGFHGLTGEPVHSFLVAAFDLGDFVRVRVEDLLDDGCYASRISLKLAHE